MPTSALVEPLESRQLMARVVPNPFLETSWGNAGVANVAFRSAVGDALVSTQLATNSSGETFVLGRTKRAVQVRKLTASGAVDTRWMPATGNLLYIRDSSGSQDIQVDGAGRLLVLAGEVLFRFSKTGELDKKFGTKGHINLDVDGGNVAIDAGNSVYVSGVAFQAAAPINGGRIRRLVVKKFTASGRVDSTFGIAGRTVAPLPRGLARTTTVNAIKSGSEMLRELPAVVAQNTPRPVGEQICILPGNNAQSTADNKIVVATSLLLTDSTQPAGTQTQSAEAARFTADGELDRTYAHQGIAYLAGTPSKGTGNTRFTDYALDGVLPNGRVSISGRDVSLNRLRHSSSSYGVTANLTVNGFVAENDYYTVTHATATADGGYIGIDTTLGVSRFTVNGARTTTFNGGRALRHIGDLELATIRSPNNLLASTISGPGVATVMLFEPEIDG